MDAGVGSNESIVGAIREQVSTLPVIMYYVNFGTKTDLYSEEAVVSFFFSQRRKEEEENRIIMQTLSLFFHFCIGTQAQMLEQVLSNKSKVNF